MTLYKNVNGEKVAMSASEAEAFETARTASQEEIAARQSTEIDAAINALQADRSALKALAEGLFAAYNEALSAGGGTPLTRQQYLKWLRGQL